VRHLLPYIRPVANAPDVERVEHQPSGLQSLVVTSETVLLDGSPSPVHRHQSGNHHGRRSSDCLRWPGWLRSGWPCYIDDEARDIDGDQPPKDSVVPSRHRVTVLCAALIGRVAGCDFGIDII
jgi:hypothetical protein